MYGGRDHVTASPRPPLPGDPVQHDDPEALIEEARQRSRRRRRLYGAAAAVLALLGIVLFASFGRPESSRSASPEPPLVPIARDGEATVLAQFAKFGYGWVFVYDDGRVVFHQYGRPIYSSPAPSLLERRLTADGLDLVRSGALPASAFLHALSSRAHGNADLWTPVMGTSLPAGLWADPEFEPYVPSRYAVCNQVEPGGPGYRESLAGILQSLPAPARALLRGKERAYYRNSDLYLGDEPWSLACFVVSPEEAGVLNVVDPWPLLPHGEVASGDAG
jgi:hypothetical protein